MRSRTRAVKWSSSSKHWPPGRAPSTTSKTKRPETQPDSGRTLAASMTRRRRRRRRWSRLRFAVSVFIVFLSGLEGERGRGGEGERGRQGKGEIGQPMFFLPLSLSPPLPLSFLHSFGQHAA